MKNFAFDLFTKKIDRANRDSTLVAEMNLDTVQTTWKAKLLQLPSERKKVEYEKEYSLDFAQSVVATDPVFGTRGGAIFSISDLLGDDRYSVLIYNSAGVQSEILKSFNIVLQKISFGDRVNFGYGIFHLSGRRYDISDPDEFFYERSFGGFIFT